MNSPATVQRYDFRCRGDEWDESYPDSDGHWVKWGDHCRALEAARAASVECLKREAKAVAHGTEMESRYYTMMARAYRTEAERDEAVGLLKEASEALSAIAYWHEHGGHIDHSWLTGAAEASKRIQAHLAPKGTA